MKTEKDVEVWVVGNYPQVKSVRAMVEMLVYQIGRPYWGQDWSRWLSTKGVEIIKQYQDVPACECDLIYGSDPICGRKGRGLCKNFADFEVVSRYDGKTYKLSSRCGELLLPLSSLLPNLAPGAFPAPVEKIRDL